MTKTALLLLMSMTICISTMVFSTQPASAECQSAYLVETIV